VFFDPKCSVFRILHWVKLSSVGECARHRGGEVNDFVHVKQLP